MNDASTSSESALADLISQWQRRRSEGEAVSPAELCQDRPALLPEFARRIAALELLGGLADALHGQTTLEPAANLHQQATLATVVTPTSSSTLPAAYPYLPGYEILGELGRGGMGIVYKAQQSALGRVVALKMILLVGEDSCERFRIEAESVARLQHPHIVQVFEVGQQNGLPYMSLEFCAGGSLADKLDGTPWEPQAAARLVEMLARAMEAAHQTKVIHRDLKPANVLLTAEGEPKVTDFGLAKKLDVAQGQTRTGAVMGTPSYMAPEQANGSKDIGPAADVYALGAILYELLTGRPPFKAATTLDTIMQVVNQEPVPVRQLQPQMPRDIETICHKCLQKEPRKRYFSAMALAEDLRRFLAGDPVAARPVGRLERGWRWCGRNPGVASLMATVALVLLASSLVAWGLATWALRQKDVAELRLYASKLAQAQLEWRDNNAAGAFRLLAETRPEFRGVEYRHLRTLFNSNQRTFKLNGDGNPSITSLHVSADGKRILIGCYDKSVRVWDAENGQELLTLKGHTGIIQSVCFSPDGKRILSGSNDETVKWDNKVKLDHTVKLWDADTGQELFTFKGDETGGSKVCFSPDGKRFLSGGVATTLKLWDAHKGHELLTFKGHTASVGSFCFSPDGKRILSSSLDDTVKLWDASQGQELRTVKGSNGCVCFSPDGKHFLHVPKDSALKFSTIKLWDADKGQELLTLKGHTETVFSVCFSPDGKRIVSGSQDTTVKVWDADTGQELLTLKGHESMVLKVYFSSDGKRIFSQDPYTVKVWDADKTQEPLILRGHTLPIYSVCFSPDGKRILSGSHDNAVKLWDVDTGQELLTLEGHKSAVNSVCFSPDGKRILSGSSDKTVKVWDTEKGQELLTLKGHTGSVDSVCFSPDGKRILSGSWDNTVKVWDSETGQELLTLKGHTGIIKSVCVSPDGKRILSSSEDKTLKVWNADTGQELLALKGHTAPFTSVCFSPDGKRILSSSQDTLKLWHAGNGQELLTLKGHTSYVASVCFSPDGKRILSGGYDNAVKLWHADKGLELLTLKGHTGYVLSVCFSPDGKRFLSGSEDGTVRVWDASRSDDPRPQQQGEIISSRVKMSSP